MRNTTFTRAALVWLAAVGLCMPNLALAESTAAQPRTVSDVALRDGGVLLGQVVNADGAALPGVRVALRSGNQELGAGATDNNGYFAFSGLRTGVYQLAAAEGQAAYRVWTAPTAPPGAQSGALLVSGGGTVRGQHQPGAFGYLLSRPLLLGGLVGAAIAIPVAVHNANLNPASGN